MICVFRSIEQADGQAVRQEKEQTIEKFRVALGRQRAKRKRVITCLSSQPDRINNSESEFDLRAFNIDFVRGLP